MMLERGEKRSLAILVPPAPRPLPLLAVLLLLAGCSTVTHLHPQYAAPGPVTLAGSPEGYRDYVGVIHIHTTYSHDAQGTFESVVRVANAQRLDYVIVTEHNNLKPLQEGKQGWHGATLVLVGEELSTKGGHYLALNVTQEISRANRTTQQIIDEINRQGGLGFIAHPYFKKRRWTDWSVSGFTGIEAYNVAHDSLDENRLRLVLWTIGSSAQAFYFSLLDRPYDPLAKWDELIQQHGRVVGIGSADAHEIHILGVKFAPYEVMFQLVRTHLLIPSDSLTPELVYEALKKGHAYLAIEMVTEAKGFSFVAENGQAVLGIMGDEVSFGPNLRLNASLPKSADLTLFKDGQPIAASTTQTWQVPVTEPGTYRLEAMRQGKPWIISNPIYIRPAAQIADSPRP